MKHPGNIPSALGRAALLSLCAAFMTACLARPKIVQCDGETGCPEGYECNGETCIRPDVCGNGMLERDEECDDGNEATGDGCNDCRLERCGNAIRDPDEECDDGNMATGDGCGSLCQLETCGNDNIDPGETCDDGNDRSGDGCNATCTSKETCGNGVVDEGRGEICDDGNVRDGDDCPPMCKYLCETPELTGHRVCHDLVSWQEARHACLLYGGNLVIVDDENENLVLSELSPGRFWIGLSDIAEEDVFHWVDGSDLSYQAWAPNEPNDSGSGEDCVEAGLFAGQYWNDSSCGGPLPFICESSDCTDCQCGNGRVEQGEQCDDGNESPGDGCDAACRLELVEESERNEDGSPELGDSPLTGNDFAIVNADGPYDTDTYIAATLEPFGDEDVFMVINRGSEFVQVRFATHDAAAGLGVPCFRIDTVLLIRDSQGTILADNDDNEVGRCSGLELDIAPGETVYAHVLEFEDNNPIPAPGYWLTIDFP